MKEENTLNSELLYEAAEKLFYEKGYNDATFTELASMVGVHRSLITYYFKTKHALADRVLSKFILNYTSAVSEVLLKKMGCVDPVYESALRTFVMFNCFEENPAVSRFYLEFCDANPRILYKKIRRRPISKLKEQFEIPFDDKHLSLIQLVDDATREALTKAYFSGETDLRLDEAIEFKTKLFYQMFNLPKDYINDIYRECEAIYNEAGFTYGPGFSINIKM